MTDFLLKQDGDYLLKADGGRIILNLAVAAIPYEYRVWTPEARGTVFSADTRGTVWTGNARDDAFSPDNR